MHLTRLSPTAFKDLNLVRITAPDASAISIQETSHPCLSLTRKSNGSMNTIGRRNSIEMALQNGEHWNDWSKPWCDEKSTLPTDNILNLLYSVFGLQGWILQPFVAI